MRLWKLANSHKHILLNVREQLFCLLVSYKKKYMCDQAMGKKNAQGN